MGRRRACAVMANKVEARESEFKNPPESIQKAKKCVGKSFEWNFLLIRSNATPAHGFITFYISCSLGVLETFIKRYVAAFKQHSNHMF